MFGCWFCVTFLFTWQQLYILLLSQSICMVCSFISIWCCTLLPSPVWLPSRRLREWNFFLTMHLCISLTGWFFCESVRGLLIPDWFTVSFPSSHQVFATNVTAGSLQLIQAGMGRCLLLLHHGLSVITVCCNHCLHYVVGLKLLMTPYGEIEFTSSLSFAWLMCCC